VTSGVLRLSGRAGAVGITLSFLFYGYVLEWMTRGGRRMPEGLGILVNSLVYVMVSRFALHLQARHATVRGPRPEIESDWIGSAQGGRRADSVTMPVQNGLSRGAGLGFDVGHCAERARAPACPRGSGRSESRGGPSSGLRSAPSSRPS
jgi:hypothetical protein